MLWPIPHLTVNTHNTISFFHSHLPLKALCCHDAWINCQQLGYCCVVARIHQADQECLILFLHSPSVCMRLPLSYAVLTDCMLSGAITIFFHSLFVQNGTESSSIVFIKTIKVEVFNTDFINLGLYKEHKKRSEKQQKNQTTSTFSYPVLPSKTLLPYSRKISFQKSINLNTCMSGYDHKKIFQYISLKEHKSH